MSGLSDAVAKQINSQCQQDIQDESQGEILSGTVVDEPPSGHPPVPPVNLDEALKSRVTMGEWDNLEDLPSFRILTAEGQLMIRTQAIDARIRQLEERLPMLLNQYLHDSYIQVLKKIHALRKTKAALFYYFYKQSGQRDLGDGK